MELNFRQPETFEAPDLDGNIKRYIIYPVPVEALPKLMELVDLRKLRSKIKVKEEVSREKPKESKKSKGRGRPKKNKEEQTLQKLTKGEIELTKQIGELANFIINECVLEVETNEPLPMYHRTPNSLMSLVDKIIEATNVGSEDKDPLPKSTPEKTS